MRRYQTNCRSDALGTCEYLFEVLMTYGTVQAEFDRLSKICLEPVWPASNVDEIRLSHFSRDD
jgi:hypothetical protein